jgi:hypothetical protein
MGERKKRKKRKEKQNEENRRWRRGRSGQIRNKVTVCVPFVHVYSSENHHSTTTDFL